jgi:phytoene dehydrogenase-like protein
MDNVTFTAADAQAADPLPIPRATLETIERQRNRALEAMARARAAFAEGMEAAREAAVSFSREYKDPAALSDKAKEALFAGNAEREAVPAARRLADMGAKSLRTKPAWQSTARSGRILSKRRT